MELYQQIIIRYLEKADTIYLSGLPVNSKEIVEMACYSALKQIKCILEDESLEDSECFEKIEEIICVFEHLGSDCGNRHDF